ncbi:MAG TPA: hypothetical protein V6D17_17970 [Candidatus Obscuribacterales bacterium]
MIFFDRIFDALVRVCLALIEGVFVFVLLLLRLLWRCLDLSLRGCADLIGLLLKIVWSVLVWLCTIVAPFLRPIIRAFSSLTRPAFKMRTLLIVNLALVVFMPAFLLFDAFADGNTANAVIFGFFTALVFLGMIRLRREIGRAIAQADDQDEG